jgi:hypothetical protein
MFIVPTQGYDKRPEAAEFRVMHIHENLRILQNSLSKYLRNSP